MSDPRYPIVFPPDGPESRYREVQGKVTRRIADERGEPVTRFAAIHRALVNAQSGQTNVDVVANALYEVLFGPTTDHQITDWSDRKEM